MRVNQLQAVMTFTDNEAIVLSVGTRLQEIQRRLGGRLHMLNVPDGAPPELPRAMIRGADTVVNICLNRFDVTTKPPQHVASDFSASLNYARLRIEPIFVTLLTAAQEYLWSGVVSDLAFPNTGPLVPALTAVRPVFDKLMTIDRAGRDLASLQLQFGFKESGLFKNFTISGYESRNLPIAVARVQAPVTVNFEDCPLAESGIQIRVDINNKPNAKNAGPIDDFKALLIEQERAYRSLATDTALQGLL